MLFQPEHIGWSLDKSPLTGEPKTRTGRLWKKCMVKAGGIYKAKTMMLSKDFYFRFRVLSDPLPEIRQMHLLSMTPKMVREEGCGSMKQYLDIFNEINPGVVNPLLYWPKYEVVDRCPGCEKAISLIGDSGMIYMCKYAWDNEEGVTTQSLDPEGYEIGVQTCRQFKLRRVV
jgi:hypothetical protein